MSSSGNIGSASEHHGSTFTPTVAAGAALFEPSRPATPFRRFSADCETLAAEWIKSAVSSMPWNEEPVPPAQPGIEGGLWIASAPYRAYAKPRTLIDVSTLQILTNPVERPIAALEKIASDLAYCLGLPVPPVSLWERAQAPSPETKFHSISAVPFPGVERWELVQQQPLLAQLVQPHCPAAMSAMFVFDTWLQCYDHLDHGGNLLFTVQTSGDAVFAFIDYSFCMLHSWRTHGYKTGFVAPIYATGTVLSAQHVSDTVEAIESMSDLTIERVVDRVPRSFLTKRDGKLIVDGLKFRRDHLRAFVGAAHTGVI